MYSVFKMKIKIKCKDSATNKMFKMNNVHTSVSFSRVLKMTHPSYKL